ncbi:MAG TPA: hypothetical protein VNG33_20445, partial [Polyangiaceae bacterium]|nr:hypothetical protein [Polyangiaceae bacterium]
MRAENALPLLLLAAFGLSGAACEGYVMAPDGPAAVGPAETSDAAPQGAASDSSGVGATRQTNVLGSDAALPVWAGAIGNWCGPFDKQTLWLTARPQPLACQEASTKIYADANENTSEGLTVEIDVAKLATLPAELSSPGRYCAPGAAACSDVQVSLGIESYTPSQGLIGSWAITLPSHTELRGRLGADWCNWDELLPAHPEAE